MTQRRRRILPLLATLVVALSPLRASAALIVPQYSSLPGAFAKLYLDFDGDYTETYGIYSPGTTIAYDTDGDPTDFSSAETENIYKIWSGVAEKYSPFNLNVTTIDPGNIWNNQTMKIVIGGDGAWAPAGAGGIAAYQAFMSTSLENIGFVFPGHLANGNPRYVAEATAHEAGHAFALKHQSLWINHQKVAEYNPGDSDRAPIMGVSYFSTRGQWWLGSNTDNVLPLQDDLRLLSAIGTQRPNFGYRADDHGDTFDAADPVMIEPNFDISAHGIIEQNTDADFFSFVSPGGTARIRADVNPEAPMLDLSLGLYDSLGNVIASAATAALGEWLSVELTPGSYAIGVSSAGGYGDIGQYFISGNIVPEPGALAGAGALLAGLLLRRPARS